MTAQRIVILSVSAGAGHVRAAEALRVTALQTHPGVQATHIDLMNLVPEGFKKLYADSYIKMVEHMPALWGYLYGVTDRQSPRAPLARLRRAVERLNTRKLKSELAQLAPDVVICTHFLPAELLSRMKRRREIAARVWVQITDFDVHAMWVHDNLDGYCVASDEVAARLADKNLPRAQIHVTGIPIMPVFGARYERAQCAQELGIDPNKTTLLMMSGGVGLAGTDKLAQRLLQLPGDFQIVALAGRNARLLHALQRVAAHHPGRLTPLGYTTTIERVMCAADVAITKPGGLTVSECLALGLPMIMVSPIPGQEERNADYLLEAGAALKANDEAALVYRVQLLMNDARRIAQMRERCLAIGRPHAARDVLQAIMG
jgi:processive 1,2-diacylglycerol beta-glucosyltransferase